MDEMLYLAQLIADSRELHSKHDSVDSKKDIYAEAHPLQTTDGHSVIFFCS